jgi:hypothetical protein
VYAAVDTAFIMDGWHITLTVYSILAIIRVALIPFTFPVVTL